MSLKVAIKANQALTLPAQLVASFVNQKKEKTEIDLSWQDVEAFEDGSVTQLELDDKTITGEDVTRGIADHYPDLRVGQEQIVCNCIFYSIAESPPCYNNHFISEPS